MTVIVGQRSSVWHRRVVLGTSCVLRIVRDQWRCYFVQLSCLTGAQSISPLTEHGDGRVCKKSFAYEFKAPHRNSIACALQPCPLGSVQNKPCGTVSPLWVRTLLMHLSGQAGRRQHRHRHPQSPSSLHVQSCPSFSVFSSRGIPEIIAD